MPKRVNKAPTDLRNLITESFSVARFETYHPGIFENNVGEHTLSCIELVDTLPLSLDSKNEIKKYLWVHDLPEIITSDYTVTEKKDQKLAEQLRNEEYKAAKTLLPGKYLQLLKDFNSASDRLKGVKIKFTPPQKAVIAVLIDRIEGNIFFHTKLAKWINSDAYNPQHVPERYALIHTFISSQRFKQYLPDCNLDTEFQQAAVYLLEFQMSKVVEAWKNVPPDRIPSIIAEKLSNY